LAVSRRIAGEAGEHAIFQGEGYIALRHRCRRSESQKDRQQTGERSTKTHMMSLLDLPAQGRAYSFDSWYGSRTRSRPDANGLGRTACRNSIDLARKLMLGAGACALHQFEFSSPRFL
jgi:hypothetical protein